MKDYLEYAGKVCIVTGASSGMGKATTELLVEQGAIVYAMDVNLCEVKGIEKFIKVNLAEQSSIDEAFQELPEKIDVFFGVAGLSGVRTDYMTTFHVNYTANVYMTENYLKTRMTENGAICYVSSMSGVAWRNHMNECEYILPYKTWSEIDHKIHELITDEFPTTHAYMYSKRLMNAYACQAAVEFAKQGVRVNVVLPGSTDTGMKDEFAKMAGGLDNMVKYAGLAGRLAKSEEMAFPLIFLGSPMASFISGEELIVDYCDNAMKKLGMKIEVCDGNCF